MTKIIKKLDQDFSESSGVYSQVYLRGDDFISAVSKLVNLKPNEKINGFIIEENFLKVNIGRK